MDIFEHRYYRLSKKFMTILGQWPYQSTSSRRGFLVVSIFIFATGWVPLLLAYVKHRDDRRIFLECVIICLAGAIGLIKLICIMWNSEKTLMLLDRICTNWQVWGRHREVNILHKYAEQGGKIIIVYTAVFFLHMTIFTTEPVISTIIGVILANGTEPAKFPYPVDYYYFDAQKYYCYVMMYCYICVFVAVMPVIAGDCMLIIYVQHVCGVFAALRHKSKQIGRNDASAKNFVRLSSFIERHNDSIEYAKLIEATYTWDLFFTIGLGMIVVNLFGLQILMGANNPESVIRFVVAVLTFGFILYGDCYICQMLIDHSINVGFYVRWYRLLPRDRKFLQMITMRCRVPCQVTAGKMLIMSISSFGLLVRTAMSYFAVIRRMNNRYNIG